MLAPGARSTLGLKVTGPTTEGIQKLAEKVEAVLKADTATRSVFAERRQWVLSRRRLGS